MWKRLAVLGLSALTLLGCGSGQALTEPTPDQLQAMQTPDGTVRLYADLLKGEQYAQVGPLLTADFRSALSEGVSSLVAHYESTTRYSGPLTSYTIEETRSLTPTSAEVDTIEQTEHGPRSGDQLTYVLTKSDLGWQIADVRVRG
jgi:hypothetical protein